MVTIFAHRLLEEDLRNYVSDSCDRLEFRQIKDPRWFFPKIRARLLRCMGEWSRYALEMDKRPIIQKKYMVRDRASHPFAYFANKVGAKILLILRKVPYEVDFIRRFIFFIPLQRNFGDLDCLLVASVDHPQDRRALYRCRTGGIPVVLLVHSWDNLTSHGFFSAPPDRLLVWNEFMKEDAIKFHEFPEEKIDIVGAPFLERYKYYMPLTDRQRLCERLNISEQKKIITYACNADWCIPDEREFLAKLLEEIQQDRFGAVVLVVRLHPTELRCQEYPSYFSVYQDHIFFDYADAGFSAANPESAGSGRAIRDFVELMQYSDVVINFASTISLDAVFFDTPAICPLFNLLLSEDAWNSARAVHVDSDHFVRVIDSGAVSTPENWEELRAAILQSIHSPDTRKVERKRLTSRMFPDVPTSTLIRESIDRVIRQRA